MTVAIALSCSDGVVVASDSMSSSGNIALQGRKVHALESLRFVWTAAGSVYVIEEVATALRELDQEARRTSEVMKSFAVPDLPTIRRNIATYVWQGMKKAYGSAMPGVQPVPTRDGGTQHPWASDVLVAGYSTGKPYLLELAGDGQINWHNDAMFAAVGSGGEFATVARALMEHYVGADLPVELGLRVAARTIETTCRVSSAFVRPPVQIAVVDEVGARVLDEGEVEAIMNAVQGWLLAERDTIRMSAATEEHALDTPPRLPGGESEPPSP